MASSMALGYRFARAAASPADKGLPSEGIGGMFPELMDERETESEQLSIRCPGCGQRFKVGAELKDRMVECGSCDHRFRVTDEVTRRSRRFYPGEHRDPSLERFGRVPMKSMPQPNFQTVDMPPTDQDGPSTVEPISPARVILGFSAIAGAVIVALILMFGGSSGGLLDGAPMSKRLVLAGFATAISAALLVAANPATRGRAIVGSVAVAALLFSLPFFFREGLPMADETDTTAGVADGPPAESSAPAEPGEDPLAELKEEMGYGKMAEALEEYGAGGVSNGRTAVGIWLHDLRMLHKQQVQDYMVRQTGAHETRSWMYRREDGYLLVLHDVPPDLRAIAGDCRRFGTVERIVDPLQVVEVTVDGSAFAQGPLDKMQDPTDPSFYELNRRELESIDLDRVAAAARRLASAEPRLYRPDIAARLRKLLGMGEDEFKRDIARALAVWAEKEDGSVAAMREAAEQFMERNRTVPRPVVEFLVDRRDAKSVDLVHRLWLEDASEWERVYGEMGPMIEEPVLEVYPELSEIMKLSAIRLLGRVGTEKSLAFFEERRAEAVSDAAVLMDQAMERIRERR